MHHQNKTSANATIKNNVYAGNCKSAAMCQVCAICLDTVGVASSNLASRTISEPIFQHFINFDGAKVVQIILRRLTK
jgi:hypothetical protein